MALADHIYDALEGSLRSSVHNALEIGIFNGDGTARIAKQFPNKLIFAIDPFIEDGYTTAVSNVSTGERTGTQRNACTENFKDCPNIVLYEETSSNFYTRLTDTMVEQMQVAWVSIDGDHHYDHVVNDYKLAMKLIDNKQGGVIFDDLELPEVRKAFDEFVGEFQDRIANLNDLNNQPAYMRVVHIKEK